jgi:hypothetical protein
MTTLKISFYKNIKSVLVLVYYYFLILGGKGVWEGMNLMLGQNFFFHNKS